MGLILDTTNDLVELDTESSLLSRLAVRDQLGGGLLWLLVPGQEYPALAIRLTGTIADICFFPAAGHPGFRALAGDDDPLQAEEEVPFIYEGADPGSGEMVPAEFVLGTATALRVALEFFRTQERSGACEWLEL